MELKSYDIIKRPRVTTKSIDLYRKLGKYTFDVHQKANKVMVREAVEKLWNVKVEKVCIVNVAGKTKTFNRKQYAMSDLKKAIVTLKQGYKVEIPGMFENVMSEKMPHEQMEAKE